MSDRVLLEAERDRGREVWVEEALSEMVRIEAERDRGRKGWVGEILS